jgi:hypothetical protein
MGKRRTPQDIQFNEQLLDRLWSKNYIDGETCIITFRDLVHGNYRGSFPYTVPAGVGKKYLIKQNKRTRGSSPVNTTYSIIKIKIA